MHAPPDRPGCHSDAQPSLVCLDRQCADCSRVRDALHLFEAAAIPSGRLIEDNFLTLDVTDMGVGSYGQVYTTRTPYPITLNSAVSTARRLVSFTHELLHIVVEDQQLPLSHEILHSFAVAAYLELLPLLARLRLGEHAASTRWLAYELTDTREIVLASEMFPLTVIAPRGSAALAVAVELVRLLLSLLKIELSETQITGLAQYCFSVVTPYVNHLSEI